MKTITSRDITPVGDRLFKVLQRFRLQTDGAGLRVVNAGGQADA
jgi:hypothetical protein